MWTKCGVPFGNTCSGEPCRSPPPPFRPFPMPAFPHPPTRHIPPPPHPIALVGQWLPPLDLGGATRTADHPGTDDPQNCGMVSRGGRGLTAVCQANHAVGPKPQGVCQNTGMGNRDSGAMVELGGTCGQIGAQRARAVPRERPLEGCLVKGKRFARSTAPTQISENRTELAGRKELICTRGSESASGAHSQ